MHTDITPENGLELINKSEVLQHPLSQQQGENPLSAATSDNRNQETSNHPDPGTGENRDLEAGTNNTQATHPPFNIKDTLLKTALLSTGLYGFFLGMDFIGTAAKILGARSTSAYFDVVNDDAGAWALGVAFTVLVQSSSTASSVIIKLVGEGELSKRTAAFMIFGANLGTSVTNTLVNFFFLLPILRMPNTQEKIEKIKKYAKSFVETSQHELFNIYSTILNSSLQGACGLFTLMASGLTTAFNISNDDKPSEGIDFLKTIVAPVRELFISSSSDCIKLFTEEPHTANCKNLSAASGGLLYEWFDENGGGVATLVVGLLLLSGSLMLLTKTLNKIFEGPIRRKVKQFLDGSRPISLLLLGIVGTVLVQSSSVFTSALAILIHQRIISRDQSLVLQMGSNIGTCFTGIMSASTASRQKDAFQIAFVHLLFNIPMLSSYFAKEKMYHKPTDVAEVILKKYPAIASVAWTASVFFITPAIVLSLSLSLNSNRENEAVGFNRNDCPLSCGR